MQINCRSKGFLIVLLCKEKTLKAARSNLGLMVIMIFVVHFSLL